MGKKITTLYLDRELVEAAKARGINISELINEVLRGILGNEKRRRLEEIEARIRELRAELAVLEAQRKQLMKEIEEEEMKQRKEEALKDMLGEFKELLKRKNEIRGSREEIEINKRIETLKARIAEITGIQFGTQEWVEMMRRLNSEGVEGAVRWALNRKS